MLLCRTWACRSHALPPAGLPADGLRRNPSVWQAKRGSEWPGGSSGSAPGLHEAREQTSFGPLHRLNRRQIGVRACLSLQGGQCDIGRECDQLHCRQLRQAILARVALRPVRAVQQVRDGRPTDVLVGCRAHTCLERPAPLRLIPLWTRLPGTPLADWEYHLRWSVSNRSGRQISGKAVSPNRPPCRPASVCSQYLHFQENSNGQGTNAQQSRAEETQEGQDQACRTGPAFRGCAGKIVNSHTDQEVATAPCSGCRRCL